ncbi:hypothetical protein RZS28_06690 [Methylocapsa polymorpha]|uniref:Uncharacterized protein n=1 Tax=Methylocapsa polymorpha TaxID=3080828 RepID=A0ABZ0HUL2_9HYPH|nr:hypothetical protein RZS28_06690 [Methylocapsa sp. RX1]
MIAKLVGQGFRALCYAALAALAGSFAIIAVFSAGNLCSRIDEGQVVCETLVLTRVAEAATAVVLLSVFTLAPLVLALCGLIFLLRDGARRWRAPARRG